MNPHLKCAQLARGVNGDTGFSFGVQEMLALSAWFQPGSSSINGRS
jgi:hypothetical protein